MCAQVCAYKCRIRLRIFRCIYIYIITYGSEVWNRGMERILQGGMERGYGTGVWNGGMERVWSRSLFRTSYFDLHPYVYIILHGLLVPGSWSAGSVPGRHVHQRSDRETHPLVKQDRSAVVNGWGLMPLAYGTRLWDPQMFEIFWRTMKGHPIGCARCVHLLVDSLQVFSFAVQSLCSVHKTILRSWFASKLVYQFPKVDGLNISHTWAKLIYTRQVQFSGSTGSPISPVHI